MHIVIILIESIIIGGLVGFAAGVGAARMFNAPTVQALGAFRTLGEMNAAQGDPASHFSFGLGFFFNAWASTVGAGAFTQDVTHRVIPNWAVAALLLKNKSIDETMHNPKKMGIASAVIGIVVVAFLNVTSSSIPESLQVTAVKVLVPAATLLINTVMPIIFWLAAIDAGRRSGLFGTIFGGFAAWLIQQGYIDGDADEQAQLASASEAMYLPYDATNQVTAQDDNSPKMPLWPFATTAATQYPLLLHYHPLMIYRHRVNKQADTLLAEMLFPEDQSQEQLARDYDYYEPITTHDSSLSRSIFSILASRLDRRDKAYNYYMDTSLMDLVDLQGNAKDGLHEANLGGSWLGLTYGFAGMYVAAGKLHITNHLPQEINQLSYRLRFRGRVLEVQLTQGSTQVQVVSGTPLMIVVDGREVEVTSKTVANG